ncbi:MAG: hypothetical protein KDB18_13660, partial [Salinibacterium sp.]|nr:hypothetical protein [Salinibacterium sp.]
MSLLRWICVAATVLVAFGTSCASPDTEHGDNRPAGAEASVSIRANDALDDDELRAAARRELRSFDEHRRRADLEDAAFAIKSHLRGLGYYHAEVEFETVPADGEIETASLIVAEGLRYSCAKVQLDIDEKVDEVKPKAFFKHLEGEPYRRRAVESAMKEAESAYLLAGYYEVTLTRLDPEFDESQLVATPKVQIRVGPRYTLDFIPPETGLPSTLEIAALEWSKSKNNAFHVRRPAELASDLRNELLDLGHQLADVGANTEIDEEHHRATVKLAVKAGPQLVLRDILVEGLDPEVDRTDPDFVRDVFDLKPGDVLAQNRIDEAVGRLYKTGIFGRVGVTPMPAEG